jgi:hypothetical protein
MHRRKRNPQNEENRIERDTGPDVVPQKSRKEWVSYGDKVDNQREGYGGLSSSY